MAERGKDLDRALDLAQEAKAKLPDNPNAADTLGWVLYKKNVPAAAISYLREAVGGLRPEDPSLPLVRHHLALAYEANEEPEQAIAALEQAVVELDALRTGADGKPRPEAPWAQDVRDQLSRLQVRRPGRLSGGRRRSRTGDEVERLRMRAASPLPASEDGSAAGR